MGGLSSLELLNQAKPETWAQLCEWLVGVGVTPERVEPLIDVARGVPEPMRAPLLQYHLRRLPGELPLVLRLLFFCDRVDVAELHSVVGSERAAWLEAAGLVTERGGIARSPFEIGLFGRRFILADQHLLPGDLVMGGWRATGSLLKLAYPRERVERALDLGCGAGGLALGLSGVANRVIMTDIYPRAIDFGRVNISLNRANNVEARLGDLFAPVVGETFDLVVCQPPFVSAPPEASATYLHGGTRGDELVRRLLRELPAYLAPGGRAYLYLQMPNERGQALLDTMRDLLGPSVALLLLEDRQLDLDEYCSIHESRSLHEGYEVYAESVQRRREHLYRTGIDSITSAYLVVINQEPVFAQAYQATDLVWGNGSNADVEALVFGLALAYASDAQLASTKLEFRGEPNCYESEGAIRIESPPLASVQWDKDRFGLLVAAVQSPSPSVRSSLNCALETTQRGASQAPSWKSSAKPGVKG